MEEGRLGFVKGQGRRRGLELIVERDRGGGGGGWMTGADILEGSGAGWGGGGGC